MNRQRLPENSNTLTPALSQSERGKMLGRRDAYPTKERGAAMVLALVTLLVVSLIAGVIVQALAAAHRQSRRYADELQAQWLAEAGLARGLARLSADKDYAGESWKAAVLPAESGESAPESLGLVAIRLETIPSQVDRPATQKLVAEAIYPNHEIRRVLIRRELSLPANPPAESPGANP